MANDFIKADVTGLDDLLKALRDRSDPARCKMALRQSAMAGAGVVKRAAQGDARSTEVAFVADHLVVKYKLLKGFVGSGNVRVDKTPWPDKSGMVAQKWVKQGMAYIRTASSILHAYEFGERGKPGNMFLSRTFQRAKQAAFDAIAAKLKEFVDNPDKVR
jgi:hypothetical protein